MAKQQLAGTFFADRAQMAGKVAVITGAASGIGLEMAHRCVLSFGMHVIMGDVDAAGLSREVERLNGLVGAKGGGATGVLTDVRKREDVVKLLEAGQKAGGGSVDVALFNAGVLGGGVNVLKSNEADWRWVLDVNLFGVLHGVIRS
jgi:NAD(P)-dependent dehydrogenase (short-subunit alcohol dehydrogenase family)